MQKLEIIGHNIEELDKIKKEPVELYELTLSQAVSYAVDKVREQHPQLSNKQAQQLVKNALIYNCVIDEIVGQVDFLLGN